MKILPAMLQTTLMQSMVLLEGWTRMVSPSFVVGQEMGPVSITGTVSPLKETAGKTG